MREQTYHSVEHRILETFPPGSAYSRDDVAQAELPAGIKHFLLSALHRRSELEASELLNVRSEWFDSENEAYRKVLQQAVLTLGNSARFPASEWPKAVHQAVEHVVEYLVSPVSMLIRFVFPADSDYISDTGLLRI